MNGKEFWVVACEWSDLKDERQPVLRSVASRAYYGALHHGKDFITNRLCLTMPEKVVNTHENLIRVLKWSGHPKVGDASDALKSLRECRVDADYKLSKRQAGERKAAEFAIAEAERIMGLIDECGSDAERAAAQKSLVAMLRQNNMFTGWQITRQLS